MRKERLMQIYAALKEKGYNPVGQIVGYILSEDPTYITNHAGARQMIARIDREELLKDMIADYLGKGMLYRRCRSSAPASFCLKRITGLN